MNCRVDECSKPVKIKSKRLCSMHYTRLIRTGTTDAPHKPTRQDRFWSKVQVGHPLACWQWIAGLTGSGYGGFSWREGGKVVSAGAHKYAYELLMGPVPDGLHLDHLCRNTACVNPDHLEAVTPRENTLRGVGPSADNAAKSECAYGHPFNDENTWFDPKRNTRHCLTCNRRRWHEWNRGRTEAEFARTGPEVRP